MKLLSPFRSLSASLFIALLLQAQGCSAQASTAPTVTMDIQKTTFTLEVADTDAAKERGLMYRDSLPQDHGMIFVLPRPMIQAFWMHNTRINLDIIWLDKDGKIVQLTTMKAYDEHEQANKDLALYVLELNAGTAAKLGLKIGDKLTLPEKVLKPAAAPSEK